MKVPKPGLWPASVAVLLLVTGFLTACEHFTDALSPVEPPEFENPIDPGGSEFVPPTTMITEGPSDGSTVTTDQVAFTWQGNENATLFQVRITGGEWDGSWSSWSGMQSLTLDFLDELTYTFEVRSGYPSSGDPEHVDDTPESRNFTVDAVQGPALRMSPTRIHTPNNTTFDLQIIAEDVSDLTMTRIRIRFNTGFLQYADSYAFGSFLTSNGGSILEFDPFIDNVTGIVELNFGVAGANPPGVSGTGTILTVSFRAVGTGTTDVIFGPANTLLRDHLNQGISITTQDLHGARVIIQ